MFNNLIARAIVPITIAVTGFVVFGCILLHSFIKGDMTEEGIRHVDSLAETVVKSTRYAMLKDDRESLRNIVENIGTLSEVGHVRIFDKQGEIHFSGHPVEIQTGLDAAAIDPWMASTMAPDFAERGKQHHNISGKDGLIAVSIPILNETKCSTASCHFHAETEPVLGFLNIGISRAPLEKTLALLKSRMIIFSLMVLFLTIGGVAALLRMNLFLPILRLTYCVQQAVLGVQAKDLPKADRKLGHLDKDFRLLVQQRDQAWQDQKKARFSDKAADDEFTSDPGSKNHDAEYRAAADAGAGENPQI